MGSPIDADVRARALDPQTSFIVQAPAGSGKTELLTRRVLTLLATVDEPEEILAITFTRKAASEMRQRVVATLVSVANGSQPVNDYEAEGHSLALTVLERDKERDWQLIKNPQRLNLRTIDALATQLAHRLPVTSALGAPTGVVEDAGSLYRDVASRFIDENIELMQRVLLQLGNRLEQAQSLLANLLANRDQWKRHVYAVDDHDALRDVLEGMLTELVESRLANLHACLPYSLNDVLPQRLQVACGFMLEDVGGDLDEIPFEMQPWLDIGSLPGHSKSDLNGWDGIGAALLTKQGDVRKSVTKTIGFPAKGDAKKRGVPPAMLEDHKREMLEILESVRNAPEFVEALVEVCSLPYPRYQDDQWDLLSELLSVLPHLLLELQVVFSERGVVDFAELSERAQWALGPDDSPTDLALSMDLSLKHVLVDEFQDTSQTQFRLFSQLVRGWDPGDGRTFFAVGDPMQSIYRFREGDVALFGQAREHGIGPVTLDSLTLTVNFRAAPKVIDWINNSFLTIFPKRANPDSGAVPYSMSVAHLTNEGSVNIHPLIDKDKTVESTLVARLAGEAIKSDPEHRVAILVRARGQAAEIFAALRLHGLAYQSIDMDLVGDRPVVRDLLSLCLALRYPHDRLHWLSLLRAPFVGLTLNDLHALMLDAGRVSVMDLLGDTERITTLSQDGQLRARRFVAIIGPAMKHVSRGALMPWVESVWLQLGGPVVCRDDVDASAAERAIRRLVALEAEGRLWQKSVLNDVMKSLYAQNSEDTKCQIQVMTLHKAKGLEFDTVILPALDRQTRADSTQMLNWFESTLDGKPQLLLAPFEQSGLQYGQRDKINRLVRKARERCDEQEKLRLLYVACTRAKHHLHLIARSAHSASGELRAPITSSLLKPLWPLLEPDFKTSAASATDRTASNAQLTDLEGTKQQIAFEIEDQPLHPRLERLPIDGQFPLAKVFEWNSREQNEKSPDDKLEFSWAGREARDIGTVVHLHLQGLASDSQRPASKFDTGNDRVIIERQLRNLGVAAHRISTAADRVVHGVENALNDERGQWVLASHVDARSEWALSVPLDAADPALGVYKVVIDRTFVDDEGTRWIIDFKTGDHSGGQLDAFLDSEQSRYSDQLNRYADIIARIENRPIRVGLYFPMLKGWREWQPQLTSSRL
ncbi:MAG: ATP-dependent helicase/nuclease subunit A [Granulosicoccus sp.]|jgi:ATP-dependent helicase/nuclease subunit A